MTRRFARRQFLGGAGVAIGLPWAIRGSLQANAATDACAAPQRLIVYYLPNGMIMPAFTPDGVGSTWTPSRILQPIAAFQSDVTVITGLQNAPGIPERGAYHAGATGAFVTSNHVAPDTTTIRAAVSLDQRIAQKLAACTRLPSLQLGLDDGRSAGDCDHGYSCAYWTNISWATPTALLPKIVNPRVAFDRIFEGFDPEATLQERNRRQHYKKSVLDYALAEAQELNAELGGEDKLKLDQYLTSVREVERRVDATGTDPVLGCHQPPPLENSDDVHQRVDAMTAIMKLALQCDATRVISFMLGNSVSERNFDFLGASGNYHGISHHGDKPDEIEKLIKIETWELEQFAKLLAALKETEDFDGKTLLDNTCVYLSSEFSDPNSHDYRDLPTLLAGSCGGAFKSGQHLRVPEGTPMANLFVNILQAFGLAESSFGDDGTAPLTALG